MITVYAGLAAAALAWGGNTLLVRRWGDFCVVWVAPAFEELVKTIIALLLGASLVGAHLIFGLVEAIHDMAASRRHGFPSAVSALISHGFFGMATYYIWQYSGMWFLAVGTAALLHTAVNILSARLLRSVR